MTPSATIARATAATTTHARRRSAAAPADDAAVVAMQAKRHGEQPAHGGLRREKRPAPPRQPRARHHSPPSAPSPRGRLTDSRRNLTNSRRLRAGPDAAGATSANLTRIWIESDTARCWASSFTIHPSMPSGVELRIDRTVQRVGRNQPRRRRHLLHQLAVRCGRSAFYPDASRMDGKARRPAIGRYRFRSKILRQMAEVAPAASGPARRPATVRQIPSAIREASSRRRGAGR